MNARVIPFTVMIGLLTSAVTCQAGKLVVILHQGGTTWQLQDAEKVTINGKNKFRQGANKGAVQVSQESYKGMMPVPVGSVAMRVHRDGYMVLSAGSAWNPAAPDGVSVKAPLPLASLWASATVQIQPDAKSKFVEYKFADVFAILPGASAPDTAVDFLANESNFREVGEKTPVDAFNERMSLLVGIAGTVTGGASAKLKNMLLTEINGALQRSNSGTTRYAEIVQGLKYTDVSDRAFPADADQKKARDALRAKKAALDQRMAILRALSAGGQWDAFIGKYGDFEQYDNAFEDLRKLRERSHQESGVEHLAEGKRLSAEKNYAAALNEIQVSLKSNPGNKEAQALFETVRIQSADDKAGRTIKQVKPRDPVVQRQMTRLLAMADSDLADGKLSDAQGEIESAETLDKNAFETRLARAKLYRAQKDYPKALATLNSYDEMPKSDDAIAAGEVLRAKINVETRNGKTNLKAGIAKAMDDGDFTLAMKQARDGLQFDPEDIDFLYFGGVNAAILRDETESAAALKKYLAASEPYAAESKRRAEVFNILTVIGAAPAKSQKGKPNWFSGAPCEEGLMYCPESLMPNVSPASVRASRKQNAIFSWQRGVLSSIRTETMEQGTSEVAIYFDYYGENQGVRRVSKEPFGDKDPGGVPRLTATGTAGPGKGAYPALFTDKVVNPWMVEKLTGKRVAMLVTGNPWFHPFVWDGVYEFLAEYDAQGRVISARELKSKEQRVLDFTWDGNRLMSIAERGRDGYRREMKYSGTEIVGELIQTQGKTSKIKYTYQGGRLVEADCDADPSLDSRSRHVTFTY